MHETAAERERRLRQLGGGSDLWFATSYVFESMLPDFVETNPCEEIMITSSQRCILGTNPLIKFTKYKFKF